MINLINGDAIHIIPTITDKSIDAVITDPPYNLSKDNNFHTMGRFGIDFGEWDKGFDQELWIDLIAPKVKPGGNIVIFNNWKNFTIITDCLERNGFAVKDLIRWTKTNPMPRNTNRRFVPDYESAVWAAKKGAKWTFNNISGKYEKPEIIGPIVGPAERKICGGHPNQKPEYVMRWIIERLTKENDLILDPFMGSGTTGAAALSINRRFMGFELEESSFNSAKTRLLG
jgi:DNA modification methylase